MRTFTAVALAALVALSVATTPAAAKRSPAAKLRAQVATLKHKLSHERRRDGRLTADLSNLKQQLAERTAERDRALGRAAALQAQLTSMPSPLAQAVEQVRREVAYGQRTLAVAGAPAQRDALVAHAAMTYVVGHVSAPAYGYMNELLGTLPEPTANGALSAGAGICGHAALTFAAIVKRFGLPVRSVQFYYGTNNHIAAEVFYDGDWHYFDPTYGAYYGAPDEVLSIDEARSDPSAPFRQNTTLLWWTVGMMAGYTGLLEFGVDPATRVEIDEQPFLD